MGRWHHRSGFTQGHFLLSASIFTVMCLWWGKGTRCLCDFWMGLSSNHGDMRPVDTRDTETAILPGTQKPDSSSIEGAAWFTTWLNFIYILSLFLSHPHTHTHKTNTHSWTGSYWFRFRKHTAHGSIPVLFLFSQLSSFKLTCLVRNTFTDTLYNPY